jgi:ABC-type uncharacterized transport system permease subunit
MSWWSRALVDLALTGYLWAAVQALTELAGPRPAWPVPTRAVVLAAWALHTLGLALRVLALGRAPVGGLHLALSAIVWATVLVLLWSERRWRLQSLTAFGLAPAAVLGLAAAAAPEAAVFRGAGGATVAGHGLLVLLAFGALAANAAGGLTYVVQERAIKRGRLSGVSRRLPSLDVVDRFSFQALVVGFPFLTLGIGLGLVGAAAAYGPAWLWQPTPVVALGTWAIYGVMLQLRAARGWGGRRAAYLAVVGFAALVATLTVSLLLPTRHVAL